MRKYEMSPGGISQETRLVDEAQIELLKFSKKAAEQMYSEEKFKQGVAKIIQILCDNLKSEALRQRCRATLPGYAMRLFLRQRELVSAYALWYVYTLGAKKRKIRGAERAFEVANDNISPELRSTPLFKTVELNIPDHAYDWAVPLEQYQRDYIKSIRDKTVELISMEAKEDYSTNVNMRNIAEMTVRYERQLEMISDLKDAGVKLVWIEPHANCSRRCEPWQGKLYSLDNTSGKIDGLKYQPLSNATDIETKPTSEGKVYLNGCVTGFNCRHKLLPYKKGNKPKEIPASVIARRRAIEEKQRAMERAIREQKRRYIVEKNINSKEAKKARDVAKKLTAQYEEYSRKNNAPFYRERTSMFTDANGAPIYERLDDITHATHVRIYRQQK